MNNSKEGFGLDNVGEKAAARFRIEKKQRSIQRIDQEKYMSFKSAQAQFRDCMKKFNYPFNRSVTVVSRAFDDLMLDYLFPTSDQSQVLSWEEKVDKFMTRSARFYLNLENYRRKGWNREMVISDENIEVILLEIRQILATTLNLNQVEATV